MKSARANAGGAIIVALLAVALVTASATFLIRSQSMWVMQTQTALSLSQGRQLLLAGLDWSMSILADDAHNSSIDHNHELWATRLPPSKAEDWEIVGSIEDAQSRFNLNNLVRNGKLSPPDMAVFSRLLLEVGAHPHLAQTLADRMDDDSEIGTSGSAEDGEYLKQIPPYRVANRPLTELANLARVSGFDAEIIARLSPLVTVLPRPTPVNINTAPPKVLAAVIPGLTTGEAQALANSRDNAPFNTLAELQARLPRGDLRFDARDLSVGSNFFMVTGFAKTGETKAGLAALVNREGASRPSIVWRREL
ncbi:MAG: ral secretion pathway protein [Proteobacteria bacterium]|nr:ral secretion pathway protein [Pseudomonadota bacterium]